MAEEKQETAITLKLWSIIALLAACIAWLYLGVNAVAERTTRVETTQKHVVDTLVEVKDTMKAIRTDIQCDIKEIKADVKDHINKTSVLGQVKR